MKTNVTVGVITVLLGVFGIATSTHAYSYMYTPQTYSYGGNSWQTPSYSSGWGNQNQGWNNNNWNNNWNNAGWGNQGWNNNNWNNNRYDNWRGNSVGRNTYMPANTHTTVVDPNFYISQALRTSAIPHTTSFSTPSLNFSFSRGNMRGF